MSESETTPFFFLLPHPSERRLLLRVAQEALVLPSVAVPRGTDLLDVGLFNRAIAQELGLQITTLHSMHCYNKPEPPIAVFTLENHAPDWQPTGVLDWFDKEALQSQAFASPLHRAVAEVWFAEQAQSPFLPWWRVGWLAEATDWIEGQVRHLGWTLTAPLEQRKSWYYSSVLRVPTSSGDLYFKAVPPYMSHEAALTRTLPEWIATNLSETLTVDEECLWLLSREMQGQSLEQVRTLKAWGAALRDYARFQQETIPHRESLPAMGCPDLRLHHLPERAAALFRALPALLDGLPEYLKEVELEQIAERLPKLNTLCAQAAQFAIPATLVHGDFHGLNVICAAGQTLFFDWGDACISHPFFDAMELLSSDDWLPPNENAHDTLRDIYLQEWTEYESWERLQELYALLKPLWILAMSFRYEKALLGMEVSRPLAARPRHSGARWSTQQQQYSLAVQMRALLQFLSPSACGAP